MDIWRSFTWVHAQLAASPQNCTRSCSVMINLSSCSTLQTKWSSGLGFTLNGTDESWNIQSRILWKHNFMFSSWSLIAPVIVFVVLLGIHTFVAILLHCSLFNVGCCCNDRGLEHLHEHSKVPIIHGNFKASNILFDSQFNAKVIWPQPTPNLLSCVAA